MRILLADDHHLVREAIASYLTRAAPDISCIEATDFDLVIFDHRIPGMNGLAGLDEVKKRLPDTPVAVVSGVTGATARTRCGSPCCTG
jgi:DNA-binding NarL/FixJ family response regulator